MASVRGTSIVFDTNSGTHQATSTATLSDYILILAAHTGSTAQPTITDSSGGTYAVITSALKAASADKMWLFSRNALVTATGQISFTVAPGATSGGGFNVFYVSGMSNAGTAAIRQSATIANVATTSTMSITFASPVLTANPLAGGIFNSLNTAAVTAPTGFTKDHDVGYNTPATGMATWHDDSGNTATVYFSGSTSRPFGAILAELDSSAPPNSATVTLAGKAVASATGAADVVRSGTLFGIAIAPSTQQWPNVFVDGIRGTEDGVERITEQGIQRITEHFIASGATATGNVITFATGTISQVIRSVTLTGKAVTTATGKATPANAHALLGKAVASATGALANTRADTLLGNAVTTAQGTFVKAHKNALVGSDVTMSTGTLTYSAGKSVVLIGKAASFATGTMVVARSSTLLGKAISTATGALARTNAHAASGSVATFAQGSVSDVRTSALLGKAATFATGTLSKARTNAILGQAVTNALGTLARVHTNALTGKVVLLNTGILFPTQGVAVNLIGKAATFSTGSVKVTSDHALAGVLAQFAQGTITYQAGPAPSTGGDAFFPILRPRHRHRR